MRAKEVVIWCDCEQGALFKTSLHNSEGVPVMFWITEDEKIYLQGYCSRCGREMDFLYSLVQLLFDCPSDLVPQ